MKHLALILFSLLSLTAGAQQRIYLPGDYNSDSTRTLPLKGYRRDIFNPVTGQDKTIDGYGVIRNKGGAGGGTGSTPNLQVGTVTMVPAGGVARVVRTGTDASPVFNFTVVSGPAGNVGATGPTGTSPVFTIGAVTQGAAGTQPQITITGNALNPVLNIVIPAGTPGAQGLTGNTGQTGVAGVTPIFTIGAVTKLAPGATPTVSIAGTPTNPVLNLGLVTGDAGTGGSGNGPFPVFTDPASFATATADLVLYDGSYWRRSATQVETNPENNGRYTATQYNGPTGFKYDRQFEGYAQFRWWVRSSADNHSRLRFAMASGHYDIQIEDGTYDFTDNAWSGGNYHLRGNVANPGKVIFNAKGAETRIIRGWFWYDGTSAGQIFENINIEGITFNQMSPTDVRSQNNNTGSSYGPITFEGASTRNLKVQYCNYNQISAVAITNFVFVKAGANRQVSDVTLQYCRSINPTTRARMMIEVINQDHPANDQLQGYNITASDNQLDGFDYAISIAGNFRNSLAERNLIGNCTSYGIELAGSNINSSISSNRFYGNMNVLWVSNYNGETGAAGGDYPLTGGQRYNGNSTLGQTIGRVEIRGGGDLSFNNNNLNITGDIYFRRNTLGGVTSAEFKNNHIVTNATLAFMASPAILTFEGATNVTGSGNTLERTGNSTSPLIQSTGTQSSGHNFYSNTLIAATGTTYFANINGAGAFTLGTNYKGDGTLVTPVASGTGSAGVAVYTGTAQVVFDGNSVVYGTGSTHEAANENDFTGNNFPAVAMRSLATSFPGVTFTAKNFGVFGQSTQQMAADAVTQVDSRYDATAYGRNILVVREISNDFVNNNVTVAIAYTNFVNYCQDRRRAGFKVLFLTLPTRGVAPGNMTLAEYNSRKDAINILLRKNWTLFADGIIDVGALAITFPDGVHTNDAGYALYGAETATQVAKIVQNGFNPTSLPPTATVASSGATTASPGVTSTILVTLNGTGANGSTAIVDASPYARTVTNSGVTVSSTQSKFGGTSLFFNGTSYLDLGTSTDYNFGTGDFTLECWFYATQWNAPGVNPFFARTNGTVIQWTFNARTGGGSVAFNVRNPDNGGYASPGPSGSTAAPAINTWHHYAMVSQASGTVRKLYIDGALYATSTAFPSTEQQATPAPLRISSLQSGDGLFGYGHFNVTNTAKYTAPFAPPVTAAW